MKSNPAFFSALFSLLFFASCSTKAPEQEIDTPTKGKVRLSIDENLRPLADQLVDAFEYSYPDAFLIQSYNPEPKVMDELFSDSSQLAIMTRPLTKDEMKWFEAKKFGIEHIKIASDAVVILVNKNNPDSSFTVEEIRKMISGEDTLWSQIRPGSTLGRIDVVFDNNNSSNLRYLSDTLLNGKAPGKNCFAVKSNDSVVTFVNTRPNAVGIIGLNWIGDKFSDDDLANREKVVLSRIGKDSASCVHPDQSAIVTGSYPFSRGVWIVKIGKRTGLGTGFATFSLGDRGQLIVQRSGLAPARPTERQVEINNK
jgi:phosphate transport system substrate-binding protein